MCFHTSGFANPNLAKVLYHLGPDCASSNLQAVHCVATRCQFGNMVEAPRDTTIIESGPVSNEEILDLTEVCNMCFFCV